MLLVKGTVAFLSVLNLFGFQERPDVLLKLLDPLFFLAAHEKKYVIFLGFVILVFTFFVNLQST